MNWKLSAMTCALLISATASADDSSNKSSKKIVRTKKAYLACIDKQKKAGLTSQGAQHAKCYKLFPKPGSEESKALIKNVESLRQEVAGLFSQKDPCQNEQEKVHSYLPRLLQEIESRKEQDRLRALKETDKETLDQLVGCLAAAPLTINFNALNFFSKPQEADGILNYFDVLGLSEKDPVHSKSRDDVERRIFGVKNQVIGGKFEKNKSGASQRPIYAAPELAQFGMGAALSYGNGYIRLKEAVKKDATLLPHDSFDKAGEGSRQKKSDLGSYQNLYAIISQLNSAERDAMEEACTGSYYGDYIEVHLHRPVTWDLVDAMVLKYDDIAENMRSNTDEEKLQKAKDIKTHAEAFEKKTGIKIDWQGAWPQ